MNLNRANLRAEQGVPQSDTGVGERGAIDHDSVNALIGESRDVVDEDAFVVAL